MNPIDRRHAKKDLAESVASLVAEGGRALPSDDIITSRPQVTLGDWARASRPRPTLHLRSGKRSALLGN